MNTEVIYRTRVVMTLDCTDPCATWTTLTRRPKSKAARKIGDVAMVFGRAADVAAWVPVLRLPLVFLLSCVQCGLERVAEIVDGGR